MIRLNLSIMEMFVLAHFVGDYLLQNGWQAFGKAKGNFLNAPLIVHCLLYTLPFAPVMYFSGVSLYWLALVFGTHMVIDRRWPVVNFLKWKEGKLHDSSFEPPFWLVIMVDQIFHILVLAFIVLMYR